MTIFSESSMRRFALPSNLAAALLAGLLAAGCDDEPTGGGGGTPPPECLIDAVCGVGRRCVDQVCVACDPTELVYDGVDNDCDPTTRDVDLDGDGDNAATSPVQPGTDCDDDDPNRSGTAREDCLDGVDNDCDDVVDCPDVTAPEVAFATPTAGAVRGEGFTATVTATDDTGVTSVAVSVDGTPLQTFAAPPYEVAIDPATLAEGPHSLRAVATDAAGNSAEATVSFSFDFTPPTVSWVNPAEQEPPVVIESDVNDAEVAAADNVGSPTVTVYLDGNREIPLEVLQGPDYVFQLEALDLPDGLHTLEAEAVDRAGHTASATVTFDRRTEGLSFTTPANGAHVRGAFPVTVALADTTGVTRFELFVGTSAEPAERFDTLPIPDRIDAVVDSLDPAAPLADGTVALTARVTLEGGAVKQSRIYVVIDNTPPSVALVDPAPPLAAAGDYAFRVDVDDASDLARVELGLVGGAALPAPAGPPGEFTVTLDTTALLDGDAVLRVTAEDAVGNQATVDLPVVVDNPGAAVRIVQPATNTGQVGSVAFVVDMQDPDPASVVVARLAGADLPAEDPAQVGSGRYTFIADLTQLPADVLVFEAIGRDPAGGEDIASIQIRNVHPPIFYTTTPQPAPAAPTQVRVGLFAGFGGLPADARPDLLVSGSGGLTVMVGDGNGYFTERLSVLATVVTDIDTADLDGDGRTEIVAVDSRGLVILDNAGGGTFVARPVEAHQNARAVAAGDLDLDLDDDVVVALDDRVVVRLNDGTGTLGAPVTYAGVIPDVREMVIRDIIESPYPELVLARNRALTVFIPDEAGGFNAAQNSQVNERRPPNQLVQAENTGLALADTDGDGDLDAVTVANNSSLRTYLNIGGGNFTSESIEQEYVGEGGCSKVVTLHIDQDGFPDVACVDTREDALATLTNDEIDALTPAPGMGDFAVRRWALAANPTGLVAANVNGDLFDDLVAVTDDGVVVLLGNGANDFTAAPQLLGSGPPSNFALADFDLAGLPADAQDDIVVASKNVGLTDTLAEAFYGDGTGGFERAAVQQGSPWPDTTETVGMASADLDGDGDLDLAMLSRSGIAIFDNAGDGTLAMRLNAAGTGPELVAVPQATPIGLAAGDIDGDGFPELAAGFNAQQDAVTVFWNDGTGYFPTSEVLTSGFFDIVNVRMLDMDGNGLKDVVHVNDSSSDVTVHYYAPGVGTFSFASFSTASRPTDIALGELDGAPNGLSDLVVSTNGRVTYLRGQLVNGVPRFGSSLELPIAGAMPLDGVASADFNGDGLDDVVVSSKTEGRVSFLLNDGFQTFLQGPTFAAGVNAEKIEAGDFTGDGVPDLVILNVGGAVTLLKNDSARLGCEPFEIPYNGVPDDDCRASTPDDDLDRDGERSANNPFSPGGLDCDDSDPNVIACP